MDCPVCRRHLRASPTAPPLPQDGTLALLASPDADATKGLALAIASGNADLALAFVCRGARVGGMLPGVQRACTPLMFACEAGCLALVLELLDRGANPNERAVPDSRFPLLIAAEGGRREVLALLLERGAAVDAAMSDYSCAARTALLAATQAGQVDCVGLLVAAGADVNRCALRNGSTALMLAAERGALPLLRLLLASGAAVNATCSDGATALHCAAGEGWIETSKALLGAGADQRARKAPYGWSPLHEAAHSLHTEVALALVAACGGAEETVNALDLLGRSPLAVAGEKRWASMGFVRQLKRSSCARHIAPRTLNYGFHALFATAYSPQGRGE